LKIDLSAIASAKAGQSKMINYAKQSQFPKSQNIYNRNFNNQLQRKTNNGLLVKTNPNKANFIRPRLYKKGPAFQQGPWFSHPPVQIQQGRTLIASGPFCPCADSYSTAWSSESDLVPSARFE
jgi:hypothetical protein